MGPVEAATAAHIEIIQPVDYDMGKVEQDFPLIPRRVLINGHDVGMLAENGVQVYPGDGDTEVTTVTLTLLPAWVEIKRANLPPTGSGR